MYDEGVIVYGATRVLDGDVIFRDFWSVYPPGQFYLLALLFKIFGPSLLVVRGTSILVHFGLVVCAYVLARRLVSDARALFAGLGTLLALGSYRYYGYPVPTALLLTLLSCIFLARFLTERRSRDLLKAGMGTGLAIVFRHDLGSYAFLSQAAVLALTACAEARRKGGWGIRGIWTDYRGACAAFLLGTLAVVAPVAALLGIFVPARDLAWGLILYPLEVSTYALLPYPSLIAHPIRNFPFYLPFLVFGGAAFQIGRRWRAGEWSKEDALSLLLVLLVAAFSSHTLRRADVVHLLPALIPAMILLPRLPAGRRWGGVLCGCVVGLASFAPVELKMEVLQATPSRAGLVPMTLPRARGMYLPAEQAAYYEGAVRSVQECAGREERIFVGNSRHDKLFISDVMFYFLSERHSATKFHHLTLGLTTTRPVQKEIIQDLLRNSARCVVLRVTGVESFEPNKSSESSGVTDLDDFLRYNYQLARQFGPYVLLVRRTVSPLFR